MAPVTDGLNPMMDALRKPTLDFPQKPQTAQTIVAPMDSSDSSSSRTRRATVIFEKHT